MPSFIPRLEWEPINLELSTIEGNPDVTVIGIIPDNVNLYNRFPRGGLFPDTARVVNIVGNVITLSAPPGDTRASILTEFVQRLDFDYPCSVNDGEVLRVNKTISTSVAGVRQEQTNFVEGILELEFKMISPEIFYRLQESWFLYAAMIGEFQFYQHKETGQYITYTLDLNELDPTRHIPKNNDFLYKFKVRFRRVVL